MLIRKRTYLVAFMVFSAIFGWLFLTTFYVFFKDELLQAAVHERRVLTQRYEAELALMRTQMSEAHHQHRTDLANYTDALEALMSRHAVLTARHDAISQLMERAAEGNLMPKETASAPRSRPAPNPATYGRPQVDASGGPFIPFTRAPEGTSGNEQLSMAQKALSRSNIPAALDNFRSALSEQEESQFSSLDILEDLALGQAEVYTAVFDATGINPPASALKHLEERRLSTFEASVEDPTTFQRRMQDVYEAITAFQTLRQSVRSVPIARPVEGARMSSGFGRRNDPFLRRLAFHAGVDYAAPTGTPVLAPGDGTVTFSGWNGGYGRMVDIDHGNGVTTRYAHLSRSNVVVGQKVRKGQLIASVGSTGRSTGPHLHYETRVNDRAVNPMRFLNAGEILEGPSLTASIPEEE